MKNPKKIQETAAGSQSGFSLIELLCVIAVMAVMLGMMIPSLSGFRSTYERIRAANAVMNTLEQARVAALQTGSKVHVIFARANDSLTSDAMIVVGEPQMGSATTGQTLRSRWIKLPSTVRFRSAAGTLATCALPNGVGTGIFPPLAGKPQFSGMTFGATGQIEYPANGQLMLALFEGGRSGGGEDQAAGGSAQGTHGLSDSGLYEVIRLARYTGRARMDVSSLDQEGVP